jgi:hypothetical protein
LGTVLDKEVDSLLSLLLSLWSAAQKFAVIRLIYASSMQTEEIEPV